MKTLIKFLASVNWIYQLATKICAKRIVCSETPLTPEHLRSLGWEELESGVYREPNVKSRDQVIVKFENNYYRVFHGPDQTFIQLKTSREWLENYLTIVDHDRLYTLAGV